MGHANELQQLSNGSVKIDSRPHVKDFFDQGQIKVPGKSFRNVSEVLDVHELTRGNFRLDHRLLIRLEVVAFRQFFPLILFGLRLRQFSLRQLHDMHFRMRDHVELLRKFLVVGVKFNELGEEQFLRVRVLQLHVLAENA